MRNALALLCLSAMLFGCAPTSDPALPLASSRHELLGGQNGLQYWVHLDSTISFTPLSCIGSNCPHALKLSTDDHNPLNYYDEGIATVPLNDPADPDYGSLAGFNFEFYGRQASYLYVSVNGLITVDFVPGSMHYDNSTVFSSTPGMAIAAWWDDNKIVDPATDMTFQLDNTVDPPTLTFEWNRLRTIDQDGNYRSMQVKLYGISADHNNISSAPYNDYADKTDKSNMIVVTYSSNTTLTAPLGSATIGIKDELGTSASTETFPCSDHCGSSTHIGSTDKEQWPQSAIVYRPALQAYTHTAFLSGYTEITGTDITPTDRDDGFSQINLPENFMYYGVSYNKIFVSANGLITFGSPPPTGGAIFNNAQIGTAADPNNIVAAWWDDLLLPATTDPNPGSIRYEFQYAYPGGPFTQLTVQWKNAVPFAGGGVRHNMQIRLIPSDPFSRRYIIEISYGTLSSGFSADSATTGIEDRYGLIEASSRGDDFDCSPNCSTSSWTTNFKHQYIRTSFFDLWNKRFIQTGPQTLHCFRCHAEFRDNKNPVSLAAPVPANINDTFHALFCGIHNLDHNNKYVSDGMGGITTSCITNSEMPICGGTPPLFVADPGSTFSPLMNMDFNSHRDPLSLMFNPNSSHLMWFAPGRAANMPFDCSCAGDVRAQPGVMTCPPDAMMKTCSPPTDDSWVSRRGKREILTWWSEGAQNN